MKSLALLSLGSILATSSQTAAFAPHPPRWAPSTAQRPQQATVAVTTGRALPTMPTTALQGSSSSSDEGSFYARNTARTCIKRFLTQRSVQSFMYLLQECRDPHSVRWLNQYGQTNNLLQYHGTGAINTTLFGDWDSYLLDMMDEPQDVVVVSARRRGRGNGGWSKNNPYMEDQFVEFEIPIDPPSLARRILSVREQIAREWVKDLDIIKVIGDELIDNYMAKAAQAECEVDPNRPDCLGPADGKEEEGSDEAAVPPVSDIASSPSAETSSMQLNFMEGKGSFDRNGMYLLRQSIALDGQSSPIRKGSFDLLTLLCTQESVHRLLRDYKEAGPDKRPLYDWLRNYYIERVNSFFDGPQRLGRADDFLEDLLLTPPSMIKDGKHITLIDPVGLVQKIVQTRSDVAEEWKVMMESVSEDHLDLRRKLFESSTFLVVTEEENVKEGSKKKVEPKTVEYGEFE